MAKVIKKKTVKKEMPQQIQTANWFIAYLRKSWKFIIGMGIVTALIANYQPIRNIFLTEKEKHDKENFDSGEIKAPVHSPQTVQSFSEKPPTFLTSPILDTFPRIKGLLIDVEKARGDNAIAINIGGNLTLIPLENLYGRSLQLTCTNSVMYFLANGNRLYVSVEFKDILTEQHIGIIEYNRWRVYIPNALEWKYDDYKFEVKDKQGYIVCAVISTGNTIDVTGYFINPTDISILRIDGTVPIDTCISKNKPYWKREAQTEILKIKSIFPTKLL